MKKILCSLLFGLLVIEAAVCQQSMHADMFYVSNYNVASPFAIPQQHQFSNNHLSGVDYYTGLLNVNIPLGGYNDDDFDIPVSLHYTSMGFIPSAISNPVGHNWVLNIGGVITRTINGIPDDQRFFNDKIPIADVQGPKIFKKGGFLHQPYIFGGDLRRVYETGYSGHKDTFRDYAYDQESDVYTFSFGHHSGKFILNNGGTFISGDQQYKIDLKHMFAFNYDKPSECPSQSTITITAPNGNQYIFGGAYAYRDSTTLTVPVPPSIMDNDKITYINAWHLREIKAPSGRSVKFNYSTQKIKAVSAQNYVVRIYHHSYYVYKSYDGFSEPMEDQDILQPQLNGAYKYCTQREIYSTRLKSVVIDDKPVINIDYDETGNVSSIAYPQISSWAKNEFSYQNGNENYTFLKSVTNIQQEKFGFEYNLPMTFPDPATHQTDHWGFWNGKGAGIDTSKKAYEYINKLEANKAVDFEKGRTALLSQIIYPNGGFEKFEYEPNYYSTSYKLSTTELGVIEVQHNSPILCGGARICQITTSDRHTTKTRKIRYKNESGNCSGVIGFTPRYKFYENQQLRGSSFSVTSEVTHHTSFYEPTRFFRDSSIVSQCSNMDNIFNEYHIGYSDVYEEFDDKSYIHYKYSTWKDNPDSGDFGKYTPEPYNDLYARLKDTLYSQHLDRRTDSMKYELAWKYGLYRLSSKALDRGLLKEKSTYYSSYSPAEKICYEYKRLLDRNIPSTASNRFGEVEYMIPIGKPMLAKEKHTVYPQKNNTSQTITYEKTYNYSNNQLIKETIKYPSQAPITHMYEYATADTPSFNSSEGIQRLREINKIQEPIRKYIIRDSILIAATRYDYSKTDNDIPVLSSVYEYIASPKLNYKPSSSVDKTEYMETLTVTCSNHQGKPIEIQEYNKPHPTVLLWGYHGRYLIARIENATLSEVFHALGWDPTNRWLNSDPSRSDFAKLNSLRHSLPKTNVSVYEYKPQIGVTIYTDPSGRSTYYDYDLYGRLSQISNDQGNITESYDYHIK